MKNKQDGLINILLRANPIGLLIQAITYGISMFTPKEQEPNKIHSNIKHRYEK